MKDRVYFIDITKKNFNYLNNDIFESVVNDFLKDNPSIIVNEMINGDDLVKGFYEVLGNNTKHIKNASMLYDTLEKIYDYWRSSKRYILSDINKSYFINEDNFLTQFDSFNETLLKTYRDLCYRLTGKRFSVYRQLPAFADAFLLLDKTKKVPYDTLKPSKVISKIAFRTPFVSYSISNKRTGVFPIITTNPIEGLKFSDSDWMMIPLLVGTSRIFVYFKRRYISLGVSLSNLFQLDDEYKVNKPDAIILFGSNTLDGIYYDKDNDIYIASLVESDKIDYFGYMKKIILTTHNIRMINSSRLPIHGAGVSILLKNGKRKNIVLIGDSGAGKSETLEALREVSNGEILDIVTIYDDMGTFEINDNDEIVTYGTEIGAFVRTDDLAHDYVYKVFDRAIFLNPNGRNARLVLPITPYHDVIKKYKVDYLFYANNYKESKEKIIFINDKESALKIFKEGRRIALGTTSEEGMVATYFANPFGPLQLKDKTDELLDLYFSNLYNHHIGVGELFTGLALPNGKDNPKLAAEELLSLLTRIDDIDSKALQAVDNMRTTSENNGNSEMSLDDINKEIKLARLEKKK